jgi:glycosyltransferase involved in cell wall biosynthesis
MRILMISKAYVVGTYQRKLEEMARLPGIELAVIVPPIWRDPSGDLRLERVHVQGYQMFVDPMRFNGNFHLHYFPTVAHRLHNTRPDIVHIDEEPYNLATWHALRLARRAGAKTLFFSWQNIVRQYPFPFSIGERWALRNVDHVIAGTDSAAEVWRTKGYRGSMTVIPQFGIDPEIFTPSERQPPRRGFVIGYVGRLVPEKGVDLLIRALADLPPQIGGWRLEIVGQGPERESLIRLARSLHIADRIAFAGQIPSGRIPTLYRELDALVVPSRTRPNWKEQFGRIIIEAMASGVPVIGSDSGAIPGVIGDAGLLFPEDNTKALTECLATLMQDEALRCELAARGRARALEHFTHAQVAARTVAVYREMLG